MALKGIGDKLKGRARKAANNIAEKAEEAAISLARTSLNRLKEEAKDPDNQARVRRLANNVINQLKKYRSNPRVKNLIAEAEEFLSESYTHEYPCSNSIWDFILPLLIVMIIICIIMSCKKNK